jgi:hypothetical protein
MILKNGLKSKLKKSHFLSLKKGPLIKTAQGISGLKMRRACTRAIFGITRATKSMKDRIFMAEKDRSSKGWGFPKRVIEKTECAMISVPIFMESSLADRFSALLV